MEKSAMFQKGILHFSYSCPSCFDLKNLQEQNKFHVKPALLPLNSYPAVYNLESLSTYSRELRVFIQVIQD